MQIQVKDYTELQNPPKQDTATLTAEEYHFSNLISKGYSGVSAYRLAFPAKAKLRYSTIRQYASELLTNPNIITEVETSREKMARLARLSEERIEDILINDSSTAKGNKVADVAMFMYEQANGKATQKIEQKSAHVLVTYNLGGDNAPPIPKEVLDQLN